jgi:hypothetical protein
MVKDPASESRAREFVGAPTRAYRKPPGDGCGPQWLLPCPTPGLQSLRDGLQDFPLTTSGFPPSLPMENVLTHFSPDCWSRVRGVDVWLMPNLIYPGHPSSQATRTSEIIYPDPGAPTPEPV